MKSPFLQLARRLATATPATWFPACLQEASGYTPERLGDHQALQCLTGARPVPRGERLRRLAGSGALFCAPGHAPLGGLVVLPAADGLSPVTQADDLRRRLLTRGHALLDQALADPRLLAHLDLGVPAASIAGAAALQFLRDRHAFAVGHYLVCSGPAAVHTDTPAFDATSVCVQIAGLPAQAVLWLAAVIAAETGAAGALVLSEDDDSLHRLERQRPLYAQIH